TQNADGGWSYQPTTVGMGNKAVDVSGSTPAMTCAGLIGLAAFHGAAAAGYQEKGPGARVVHKVTEEGGLKMALTAVGTDGGPADARGAARQEGGCLRRQRAEGRHVHTHAGPGPRRPHGPRRQAARQARRGVRRRPTGPATARRPGGAAGADVGRVSRHQGGD